MIASGAAGTKRVQEAEPVRQTAVLRTPAAPVAAPTRTVHFQYVPDPAVFYGTARGFPACGGAADAEFTSTPEAVTCGRCKRSGPYRQSLLGPTMGDRRHLTQMRLRTWTTP
jgi:rubredoxin